MSGIAKSSLGSSNDTLKANPLLAKQPAGTDGGAFISGQPATADRSRTQGSDVRRSRLLGNPFARTSKTDKDKTGSAFSGIISSIEKALPYAGSMLPLSALAEPVVTLMLAKGAKHNLSVLEKAKLTSNFTFVSFPVLIKLMQIRHERKMQKEGLQFIKELNPLQDQIRNVESAIVIQQNVFKEQELSGKSKEHLAKTQSNVLGLLQKKEDLENKLDEIEDRQRLRDLEKETKRKNLDVVSQGVGFSNAAAAIFFDFKDIFDGNILKSRASQVKKED